MNDKMLTYAGWTLTILSALFLLMDAGMKIAGARVSIETTQQLGFAPDTTRMLGAILLASTLMYLFPKTQLLGAVLITAYLGGAIAVQLQHNAPLFSHVLFGVYVGLFVWAGIWLKSPAIRALIPIAG